MKPLPPRSWAIPRSWPEALAHAPFRTAPALSLSRERECLQARWRERAREVPPCSRSLSPLQWHVAIQAFFISLLRILVFALAGPGTIATAMSFAGTGGISEVIGTIVAFATLCVLTYLVFLSGERVLVLLGDNRLNVVTRLMGLILAVIAVQMLITGIAGAVKANLS